MKHSSEILIKVALLLLVWLAWYLVFIQPYSPGFDLAVIVGGMLLIFPVIWIARTALDRQPTLTRVHWITTAVHYTVGLLVGSAVIRAILTQENWIGWKLPIAPEIGLVLVYASGAVVLMTVINLALKGLGAPFAIALSQKLAVEWLFAWTRNPMVFSGLILLFSLGLYYQSALFLLWVLLVVTPSLLFFLKFYEERELELRFGASYLEYKAKTPMLFPRKPRS